MKLHQNKLAQELFVSITVLFLLLLLTDTIMIGMGSTLKMLFIAFLSIAIFAFLIVFWRDKSALDEREQYHNYIASKTAFMTGSLSLVLVLILQYFSFSLPHWPAWVLGIMIFSKILAFQWSEKRN